LKHRDKQSKALSTAQAFHCLSFVAAGQALRAIKGRDLGTAIVLG